LKSLGFIDYIILFQDDTPHMILSHLKPNFIVKGGDYKKDKIVGSEFAERIVLFDYIENISTTNVVKKIQQLTA
jgi:D-beta-D-heptose 7-phosphate kinase/D-beta-D-heptose 1-phosphate adenosyltransferase